MANQKCTETARKLSAHIGKLADARAKLKAQIARLEAEHGSLVDPAPLDEGAARTALARANASDAINGKSEALVLRKALDDQRAAIEAVKTGMAARRAEIDRLITEKREAIADAELQDREAQKLLSAEIQISARAALEAAEQRHTRMFREFFDSLLDLSCLYGLQNDGCGHSAEDPRWLEFHLPAFGADVPDMLQSGLVTASSDGFGGQLHSDRELLAIAIQKRHAELRAQFAGAER